MSELEKKTLLPAEGRTVVLEDGRPWPTQTKKVSGEDVVKPKAFEVEMSRYFRRRLRDGDLIDVNATDETDEVSQETTQKKSQSKGGK